MKVSVIDVIMNNAMAFHAISEKAVKAYLKLGNEENEDSRHTAYMTVAATNILLAVELYLKSLLLISVGETKKIHQLQKLFEGLPEDLKARINEEYEKIRNSTGDVFLPWGIETTYKTKPKNNPKWENYSSDLENLLKVHNDGFVEWRYGFTTIGTKIIDYYNLFFLSLALVKIVNEECRKRGITKQS